jgi:hypothetical protein
LRFIVLVSVLGHDVRALSGMRRGDPNQQRYSMKKLLLIAVASMACGSAFAQVGTAVKESGKATGEKAQQVGDEAKASVSSQPEKSADKAKAQTHKAKSHAHATTAKDAAKEVPK